MSKNDAETKLNIVRGIMENVSLHRSVDAYKKAPAEEKVAYLEGVLTSIWVATHVK